MGYEKVIGLVGYKNSGKTTFSEKLISFGSSNGLKIGTIKHHGHGGPPHLESAKTDSSKQFEAGAVVSAVEGDGTLSLQAYSDHWSLYDILKFYESFSLDFIVIEGYKNENIPKILFIRTHKDLNLLESVSNIVAVVSWIPIDESEVHCFFIEDDSTIIKWVFSFLGFDLA
ncbi:molybdopterin-guanine dinucleotide biosynthesis protein B [Bacillus pakistanensis]|uniref:Molybdopterin-guanine dinucleotide biosynthesis protein B n=1 Tax=Rossellomorea pakistanensis TaxID=992288 RepID=A0ABS2N8A9_9BACI|nr:molybdopterin-guanine dinucleotide biosynthesis protein B [Bacillus pakistanensis]